MEREEYTDQSIERLDNIDNNVSDIKTTLIFVAITLFVFILVVGGFLLYLFLNPGQ